MQRRVRLSRAKSRSRSPAAKKPRARITAQALRKRGAATKKRAQSKRVASPKSRSVSRSKSPKSRSISRSKSPKRVAESEEESEEEPWYSDEEDYYEEYESSSSEEEDLGFPFYDVFTYRDTKTFSDALQKHGYSPNKVEFYQLKTQKTLENLLQHANEKVLMITKDLFCKMVSIKFVQKFIDLPSNQRRKDVHFVYIETQDLASSEKFGLKVLTPSKKTDRDAFNFTVNNLITDTNTYYLSDVDYALFLGGFGVNLDNTRVPTSPSSDSHGRVFDFKIENKPSGKGFSDKVRTTIKNTLNILKTLTGVGTVKASPETAFTFSLKDRPALKPYRLPGAKGPSPPGGPGPSPPSGPSSSSPSGLVLTSGYGVESDAPIDLGSTAPSTEPSTFSKVGAFVKGVASKLNEVPFPAFDAVDDDVVEVVESGSGPATAPVDLTTAPKEETKSLFYRVTDTISKISFPGDYGILESGSGPATAPVDLTAAASEETKSFIEKLSSYVTTPATPVDYHSLAKVYTDMYDDWSKFFESRETEKPLLESLKGLREKDKVTEDEKQQIITLIGAMEKNALISFLTREYKRVWEDFKNEDALKFYISQFEKYTKYDGSDDNNLYSHFLMENQIYRVFSYETGLSKQLYEQLNNNNLKEVQKVNFEATKRDFLNLVLNSSKDVPFYSENLKNLYVILGEPFEEFVRE